MYLIYMFVFRYSTSCVNILMRRVDKISSLLFGCETCIAIVSFQLSELLQLQSNWLQHDSTYKYNTDTDCLILFSD
ncbi:hypothetical protein L1987_19406 [Smallanthus sonchifolius]|uniref:Uncharacterized protein n=1 Tax=Smallanthus sonchifolius TaxID=185202 RepID=A0ACB9IQR0_9ASTR|nr:hypothetical protein L1987_19406 [Smallanthus sonchifolius]